MASPAARRVAQEKGIDLVPLRTLHTTHLVSFNLGTCVRPCVYVCMCECFMRHGIIKSAPYHAVTWPLTTLCLSLVAGGWHGWPVWKLSHH
jgi:hypothetical protein